MEIKILKNASKLNGTYLFDGMVLEHTEVESEFSGINGVHLYLKQIDDNTVEEILPNIDKYNIGKIVNTSASQEYIYFFNLFQNAGEEGTVTIIRYHIKDKITESIYSFHDNIAEYAKAKRLKVFVLNDSYFIIQAEHLVLNAEQTYAGYFKFDLKFYNLKEQTEYEICDDKFTKNGISDIIALSETQCIIKTGFTLLENSLYNELEQEEASLEAISFVNIGQMISDFMIMQHNVLVETIEQAFYTKTIPYIRKSGNYLIYSCVDNEKKEEEIKFYNLETSEVKSCINQDVIRVSDLGKPYVLNGEPYICLEKEEEISFLNLTTGKIDVHYEYGLKLKHIFENAILLSGMTLGGVFKKSKPYMILYGIPGNTVLFQEIGEYVDSLMTEDDIIYILKK